MKRTILLILLSLAAGTGAWAAESSVRVGMTLTGARFRVDGQEYNSPQNFVWPEGSRHVIEFISDLTPAGVPSEYQNVVIGGPFPGENAVARYHFTGWTVTGSQDNGGGGNIVQLFAQPEITSVFGTVELEHKLYLVFETGLPDDTDAVCSSNPPQDYERVGVVYIDEQCFDRTNKEIWVTAGVHDFRAVAYLGWVFSGWTIDNHIPPDPYQSTFEINSTVTIRPLFQRAKRVRFRSIPVGLKILVDRSLITTPPPPSGDGFCQPDFTRLPINAPLGFNPLCMGDFDFIPGSEHRVGAPESQLDDHGNYWVFDGFDNGLGQNDIYVAGSDVNTVDVITAKFVRGVPANILTNVGGLKLFVDGRNNWPGPGQNFMWGEGHPHTIFAPSQLTDGNGRVWKFDHWSDGGEQEHVVAVPAGSFGFAVTAFYTILGQLQITSNPPGLTFEVGDNSCTTPCVLNGDPDSVITVTAPVKITQNEASRYELFGWVGRNSEPVQSVTLNSDVQTLGAHYRGSHLLTAMADPADAAQFTFEPSSPDGFYTDDLTVKVTVADKDGFKFQAWGGDASGTVRTVNVSMLAPRNVLAYFEEVPTITPAGIRNAAGETPDGTVAPGSIITIFGKHLAKDLAVGPLNPLAQSIGDTYVTLDTGGLLPLIFVSDGQINAQLLSNVSEGEHTLTVHNTGEPDVTGTFQVRRNAPGIFFQATESGMPLVVALHEDGTYVSEDSPAHRGEIIQFFGTGLGPWNVPVFDGFVVPPTEQRSVADPVSVIAGLPEQAAQALAAGGGTVPEPVVLEPNSAGSADGMVGTASIKLVVDEDLPSGINEIYLDVNGRHSNRVQLPVE